MLDKIFRYNYTREADLARIGSKGGKDTMKEISWKTNVLLLIFLSISFLAGCGQANVSLHNDRGIYSTLLDDWRSINNTRAPERIALFSSATDAFYAAFFEDAPVYFGFSLTSEEIPRFMSITDFLTNESFHIVPSASYPALEIVSVCAVDLDRDGVKELILGIKHNNNADIVFYIILHYNDQDCYVRAYSVPQRALCDLRENGMFYASGGSEYSYCRFRICSNNEISSLNPIEMVERVATVNFNEIVVDSNGISGPMYYVEGEVANGNEFAAVKQEFSSSPPAIWYTYSMSSITFVIDTL